MELDSQADLGRTFLEEPQVFLQPTPALHYSLLQLAKRFLDPLASDVSEAQLAKQRAERKSKKRKRSSKDVDGGREELLRMKVVHVEGFEIEQVWQQAKRVLGAATQEVDRQIPDVDGRLEEQVVDNGGSGVCSEIDERKNRAKAVRFEDAGPEFSGSDDERLSDEGVDWEYNKENIPDVEAGGLQSNGLHSRSDEESVDMGDETPPSDVSEDEQPREHFVKDPHGLNDGFFSIDQFNKSSQFLEQQDARGDPNDGAASDEEDIDWGMDPMDGVSSLQLSNQAENDNEDEEDEAEDGPIFGDADFSAPESESDHDGLEDKPEMGGMADFSNTNDILYNDFFAPPARKAGKNIRSRWREKENHRVEVGEKPNSLAMENGHDEDDDMQRTVADVRRDLFEDDASDNNISDDPKSELKDANLSTHERAQIKLRAEIRRLEAENVSAKPWALTGEAVTQARPLNSLLEEDLDYQRAGKPVPVITPEINESIEELIKRRILAREFDEVIRRRPTDLVTGLSDPRRGRLRYEVSDAKSTKGLAEEYEQDHLRRTDPSYVDIRSEALKQKHKEIEAHWSSISAQLDALSNWHYKPRPPAPTLDIRVDAPTIGMEDARPSAGGDVAGASALAPQEVYKPGDGLKGVDEVLTRGGTLVGQEEETKETKRRRRRRAKERAKKASGNPQVTNAGGAGGILAKKGTKAEKRDVVGQLKKGNVKVIGKKGELKDLEGNAVKEANGRKGAGSFRL